MARDGRENPKYACREELDLKRKFFRDGKIK
jgi:hypothetical protein